ncbi:1,4-alpha-glucan branching enzyme [Rubrobacter radiotolerans]|uniref:1,4-alpha-glucan branching enzyme GlgB n=1 Tax=Rubrobacter radiotolerans TaxID=42256 RepID=A0A023WZU9_RUBRA|nr:1,4-alpha-glucan branching protein GlgB [Rubrobacter radiotolerans]AHY45476.1 1,4-alpha-glucan branching enzyme [Rubrobacter radiotolerans]MDX5892887.1 1,4-alpha-glucan branching protein GlgB [Rubrobacter radiotolerans]SMC02686.1 1,4-alpha-glucan branching enzyme [Rubrobacter radiotolerans DSM 5868]
MNTDAASEALAIVRGEHGDPFSFLGLHEEAGRPVVRVFVPGAAAVEVVSASGKRLGALAEAHPDGLFAGFVEPTGRDYRLKVTWKSKDSNGGQKTEMPDAYSFPPTVSDYDLYLFGEGNHNRLYDVLGAHLHELDGTPGTRFAVWAPNARRVSVVGDFNAWDGRRNVMRNHNGVWEVFVPGVREGALYKFELLGANGELILKADPFGFFFEQHPGTASIVHDPTRYAWADDEWMSERAKGNDLSAPMSIYEVHLGSWKLHEDGRPYLYHELAEELVPYVKDLGYTHVEFLPPTEHPFGGSWGYQPLGLYAPTSRFGNPDDFRRLVEEFHKAGIGVIIDWVPAHFPEDAHGLANFDGTHLYEHADPRKGRHPDWGTLIFNYGRNEVRNYLTANALFWLREFHVDGLRVDAVASMLYLDYSREAGEWVPNEHGGNENLEAIALLRRTNELVYGEVPGAFTVAEESTAWPMVSRPTSMGGLGFGYKWNMGWMHDSLAYMQEDPMYRSYHHNEITFSLIYAFNENFVLPLSHDEVVHGKRSILGRMPGDTWQRFANLRAYYGFMYAHPGKQLLFMGSEFGQEREWNHDAGLDWYLLDNELNAGTLELVRRLNTVYKATPALYERDFDGRGFEWISGGDTENSVISFVRRGESPEDFVVAVCNFTPVVRERYRIGVPEADLYTELLNTDAPEFGGSGVSNGRIAVEALPEHGREHSVNLTLPPLATLLLQPAGRTADGRSS